MSTTGPRTIDNLGVDASVRYAKDKELFDTHIIEESRSVPLQTEVTVTRPYVPVEFEEFYSVQQKNVPWADFFAPPNYVSHNKKLFTHQLIPSLGPPEKQLSEQEKIINLPLPLVHRRKKEDEEKEEAEEDKERKALITFLTHLGILDRHLSDINARRSQYHKG